VDVGLGVGFSVGLGVQVAVLLGCSDGGGVEVFVFVGLAVQVAVSPVAAPGVTGTSLLQAVTSGRIAIRGRILENRIISSQDGLILAAAWQPENYMYQFVGACNFTLIRRNPDLTGRRC
jgi:hypothetical protein